jgi:CubicO group peptidase (beta-lactamase class C family)
VHYGFTGTGMWVSPAQGRWAVLLTNKLYYTRDRQSLTDVRNTFRQLAFVAERAGSGQNILTEVGQTHPVPALAADQELPAQVSLQVLQLQGHGGR